METRIILLPLFILLAGSVRAEVRVFVEEANGRAAIKYQCTAGEVVRAFALDVSVDRGQFVGISDFFKGESTAAAQGYGVFPAAFRDHILVGAGTNINWDVSEYTPVAAVADDPGGTLPGLNSSGVTLEFGGLWDPNVPGAVPPSAGTLCTLQLSEPAQVSLAANISRGGVVSATSDPITPVFTGALVGPAIISVTLEGGVILITFQGGELETATEIDGEWTGTGNTSGDFTEAVASEATKFFRVRGP